MVPADSEFVTYLLDLMRPVGPVRARRMFGGYGIFLEGLMFALVADDVLYLKADAQTTPGFEALGLSPFTYQKNGKRFSMSYYQAPDSALEGASEMRGWAADAFAVAARADACKKRPKRIR